MWFSGLAIGLPELVVASLSVFVGLPGLAFLWGQVALGPSSSGSGRVPVSLSVLTGAVLSDLLGLATLIVLPAEMLNRRHAGIEIRSFCLSTFLALGFVLLVAAVPLSRKDQAPNSRSISALLKALLTIALIGIAAIVGCLPQAPWNQS